MPAGIADGQRIRLGQRGHAGGAGALEGDLYVLVRVREDERFVREGQDLITALDVPAPLAALGGTLQAPTLQGTAAVEVPQGTQPGEVITLRGQGMPSLRGGRRGDVKVVMNVVVPRRLSEEQRELIGRLQETLTEENLRSDESMFAKLRRALRSQAGVIRLALRVRREQAEVVLAELLELVPGGRRGIRSGGRGRRVCDLRRARRAAGAARICAPRSATRWSRYPPARSPDDWSERWRDFHRPITIPSPAPARVRGLRVRTPWESPCERPGLREIVIDPGQAFGTGAHATTRLCLELLLALAGSQRRAVGADRSGERLGGARDRRGGARIRPGAGARPRPAECRGGRAQRDRQRRADRRAPFRSAPRSVADRRSSGRFR